MRPSTLCAFLLLAVLPVGATSSSIETPHLTATVSVAHSVVAAGARVSLFLDITPKPKMHVYSPQQKDYIPISIALDSNPAFKAERTVFPKPEKIFFAPLKETQLVYSKPFRIVQNVVLNYEQPSAEAIKVTGKIRYQACDDAICYLPKDVPVSWMIRLKSSALQ